MPSDGWTIWTTRNCNLSCKYCFQNHPKESMTEEVLEQTVRFIQKHQPVSVAFWGGEPCLNPEAIKRIIAETRLREYRLTTNGTLLNGELFDWIRLFRVKVLLSLDGCPEFHNKWRCNSYRRIIRNPNLLPKVTEMVLSTIVEPEKAFANTAHIKSLGFRANFHNLVNYGCEEYYSSEDVEVYAEQFEKCLSLQDESFSIGNYWKYLSILDDPNHKPGCGIKNLGFSIDVLGDIYPCHRCAELGKDFSFGDVWGGVNENLERKIREDILLPKNLPANMLPCPVECYRMHGEFGVDPPEIYSDMIKAIAKVVLAHPHPKFLEPKTPEILVGVLVSPLKHYILKLFLDNLARMKFLPNTDLFFVLDFGDVKNGLLLSQYEKTLTQFRMVHINHIPVYVEDNFMDRIGRGRNQLVKIALEKSYSHLFWLDADIIAPAYTVQSLLSADTDIIGGLVRTRRIVGNTWYNNYLDKRAEGRGFTSINTFLPNEILDVDATGNDCVLIRREVFEKIPRYEWNPRMGEDIGFCLKAKELGFKVKVHTGIKTRHVHLDDVRIDDKDS